MVRFLGCGEVEEENVGRGDREKTPIAAKTVEEIP